MSDEMIVTVPAVLVANISVDDDGEGGVDELCVYYDPSGPAIRGSEDLPRAMARAAARIMSDDDAEWPGIEVQKSRRPISLVPRAGSGDPAMTHVCVIEVAVAAYSDPSSWNWDAFLGKGAKLLASFEIDSDETPPLEGGA